MEIQALRHRFHLQETELHEANPDLIIDDSSVVSIIPDVVKENFFPNLNGTGDFTHFFTRYWHQGKWHNQTAIGFPVLGFMNDNLGVPIPIACGIRFVKDSPPELFENVYIQELLNKSITSNSQIPFSGFVTFGMTHDKLLFIQKGVPCYGLFALLEGLTCRVEQFLTEPFSHVFRPRWYVANLVSRSPFPVSHSANRTLISGLVPRVEQHFWCFAPAAVQKQSFYTSSALVGVATAWSDTLLDACSRALITCQNVRVENKQYRTDLSNEIGRRNALLGSVFENVHD